MDILKKYLDQIKAEKDLKEKTKIFLKSNFETETRQKVKKSSFREVFGMKKLLLAASAVAVCAIFTVGGYAYSRTPVNFVSLDINPSIEVGVNAFDKVVSVEGINEDGKKLLEGQKVTGLALKEAIAALVQEAAEQEYIAEDGSTVIAVTAESKKEGKAVELRNESEQGVSLAMSNKQAIATIYSDCSDLALRTEAKEMGISPGKFKLIRMLQVLDPDITLEQYKDAKVSEIIAKANEILQKEGLPEEQSVALIEVINKIEDTGNRVRAAKEQALQKQNQNANRNGVLGQEGDGALNQNKEQEQNQNRQQSQNAPGDQGNAEANRNQNQNLITVEGTQQQEAEQEREKNGTGVSPKQTDDEDLTNTNQQQNQANGAQEPLAGNTENGKDTSGSENTPGEAGNTAQDNGNGNGGGNTN